MRTFKRMSVAVGITSLLAGLLLPGVAIAITTPRVIQNISADWPDTGYAQAPRVSANGKVVAVQGTSDVPFAVPSAGVYQVFANDLGTAQIEQVSVDSSEAGIFSEAWPGGVSGDGRFIAFTGAAPTIPGGSHAYVRDRLLGVTEQMDVADGGGTTDGIVGNGAVDISDDGRFVVFFSTAANLLPPGVDTNNKYDVFVRDRTLGVTTRVSVGPGGLETDDHSYNPTISGDGSTVTFISSATNLLGVGLDNNGFRDAYAVDLATLTAERVTVADDESEANGGMNFAQVSINGDGRIVAFDSDATNLVAGDTNNRSDVFVRDRTAGTTVRASVRDDGSQAGVPGDSYSPALNADGTRVAFTSRAKLDPGKTSSDPDVFLRDVAAGTTELISRTSGGSGGDSLSGEIFNTTNLTIDGSGDAVAFGTWASNLSTPPASPSSPDVMMSRPPAVDSDGDGIADSVDTNPSVPSSAFSDGLTFGSIVFKPAGFAVAVTDALAADEGVRVVVTGFGTQMVRLSACGGMTIKIPAGGETSVTCASVILNVAAGSPPIEVVAGDGLAVVSVPGGARAEISVTPSGGFTVGNVSGGIVTVTVDGTTTTVSPGGTLTGNAWHFDGFKTPVDNGGVLNTAKAGRAVPIKWRITDSTGAPIANLTSAHLTAVSLTCPAGATLDQVEEYTTGASGLINDGNGNYHMNWATPASYANSCKTLRLDIGDGVYHTALFKMTK